ncbi:hypothetical protein [Sporosarcina sp. HYO08]|uniref:hypothetical protein n=1 Tax=Sporosarcina sp. HYO08 TaxID=1759557 RepID=UPI00079B2CE8|nr:hypothetical protein [Sporosarcina sp. HYO08]KXH86110.1 hypothetical protein AU377_14685 [Sporosarcina sp. HYO08]
MIMHVVLGDNEHTGALIEKLTKRKFELITVVDAKYKGMHRRGEVVYANIEYIKSCEDLPIEFIFYTYVCKSRRGDVV